MLIPFSAALYVCIYNYVLRMPHIAELTVEDPAEAFEDLRDRNDLRMLLAHARFIEEAFGGKEVSYGGGRVGGVGKAGKSGRGGDQKVGTQGKMGPPIDKKWAEKWRVDMKIALVCNFPDLLACVLICFGPCTEAVPEAH